jgi:carbamoyl-phosphate synthase large subunit
VFEQLKDFTRKLALALKVQGLINVQFAEKNGMVYVLEVNPRASRTVPFVSKAVGIPLAKIAAKVMTGRTLRDLGVPLNPPPRHIAVKEPVFPFGKFPKAKIYLGPEMRSTGEVMSMSDSFGEAIAKAFIGAGGDLPTKGGVFISVNTNDKNYRTLEVAKGFVNLGFNIYATKGTAAFLDEHGVKLTLVYKVNEGRPNIVDLIKNKEIDIVINTPMGEVSRYDELAIGSASLEAKVPIITTISAAAAAVKGIQWFKEKKSGVKSLQEYHAG